MAGPRGDDSIIIVMRRDAVEGDVERVVERLRDVGAEPHVSAGDVRTVIAAAGDRSAVQQVPWEAFPGVERAVPVLRAYTFVGRDHRAEDSVVDVGGVAVGDGRLTVIAGPCAVESRDQLFAAASAVAAAGARILRGDAFKPRSSPYAFQGLGEKGLELLAEARDEFGLPFVAEVLDPRDIELVSAYADLIRIGARNMHNYSLLAEAGRQDKPVLLKRGFTATVEEWLNAAEYVYKEGNHDVILCERGIRTFESQTRNTLDIAAVPLVKGLSHLPVLVDPSHSGGRKSLVPSLTLAAVAAGADGVMIDVHPSPETAQVDGPQAILPEEFTALMAQVRAVAGALGREA
ncbi:MAG TPA: 3-deoxy-7-phosphoheptulonate synthase [Acidimicrobiia bacterium]|nr:3-deoxy-7-phosphoheptulonate synthase [Acidimicrobiia bacterium]